MERGRIGKRCAGWLTALAFCAVACSGDDAKRVHVSGTVTFKGNPVPAGRIYFDADANAKNTGPQGSAEIVNGAFDTSAKGGRGAPPGKVIIRIEGFDGVASEGNAVGKPLFVEHRIYEEFPSEKSITKKYDVPAEAAKNLPKDNAPPP